MKKRYPHFILLIFIFFTGCSFQPPKAYFCISAGRVYITQHSEQTYSITMEDLQDTVIFLNDQSEKRQFGQINVSQFLNLYSIDDQSKALPVTFCYTEPKSGRIEQFTTLAFSPKYDRLKDTLVWELQKEKKEKIPAGVFLQNILVLSLDIKRAESLFKNAYSYQ